MLMALDLSGFDPFYSPISPDKEMVKDVLEELGWDSSQLAAACGVSKSTVSRWLSGEQIPRLSFYGVLFVRDAELRRRSG